MTNQQLSNYVRQQLQQGKSQEEIKSELLGAGWQEADINQAFNVSNPAPLYNTPLPPNPPAFTSTSMQQLDPKAVWLFFFRSVVISLFIVPWIMFMFMTAWIWSGLRATSTNPLPEAVGILSLIFLVALIFSFIWAKLTYHFYRYELTDAGFRKEFGVIYKKYVTIPYDRIQNVDIYRGIVARILGLSDLNIQTAGMSATVRRFGVSGGGAEGRLPAVSREIAEQLRDELIQRTRQVKNREL